LTQDLLAFSRKQAAHPKPVDLNETIKKTANLLKWMIGENVELEMALQGGILPVMAVSGQIEQVLINLATNARDAMPGIGRFTVKTSVADKDHEFFKGHDFGGTGRYVLISVSDNGMGMDEKTRARIFEPFFTTKEVRKGTGLGLATVYGIVKQHKGFINVHSEPGEGTTFNIYLPIINPAPDEQ
jgi:signal transduction histidine kinase